MDIIVPAKEWAGLNSKSKHACHKLLCLRCPIALGPYLSNISMIEQVVKQQLTEANLNGHEYQL